MVPCRTALVSLALLASAAPAGAADWYGEFHVGTTRAEHDTIAFERVEGAYGVGVGVSYNEWFSTQLDWHTLGENTIPAPCAPTPCVTPFAPYPEHGWALRALPRLPLGESFALELGIGLMRWEGDVGTFPVTRISGTDLIYSFGLGWRFAERWSATAEVQTLELDGAAFDWTGATLRYRF